MTKVAEYIAQQMYSNVSVANTATKSVVAPVYNVSGYGAKGDGTTNDYLSISNALTALNGAGGGTLYFPKGTYKLSSGITFPVTATLIFDNGAILSPDTGITVTINGPINAGIYQIFSGNGTIAGTPTVIVNIPQWFGGGVTNTTVVTQAGTTQTSFNAKFDTSTGHKHTGASGDAPIITSTGIDGGYLRANDILNAGYILSGGVCTKNGSNAKQLDVTTVNGYWLQTNGSYVYKSIPVPSQLTSTINTTYYLDIDPDGTIKWSTSHSAVTNTQNISSTTTDASGNINVITDLAQRYPKLSNNIQLPSGYPIATPIPGVKLIYGSTVGPTNSGGGIDITFSGTYTYVLPVSVLNGDAATLAFYINGVKNVGLTGMTVVTSAISASAVRINWVIMAQ